jgi:hypothetical protein
MPGPGKAKVYKVPPWQTNHRYININTWELKGSLKVHCFTIGSVPRPKIGKNPERKKMK